MRNRREKKIEKKWRQSMRTLEQHDMHQHLHYRGTRSRRERERARAHNKNFLNMGKEPLTQIQEAQRVQ